MESVESVCNTLARFKLLEVDVIRSLRVRWRELAGARADQVADFKRWLVRNGHLTDFQLDMLTRGHAEHLFFDEYKLQDRIGKGRMAGVYKAVHPSGQVVAIKVLPPSKAKIPQLLGRFMREARLAVRLDHDNVVRTFHHGQTKEGMNYIVMEYLDGETLEEVLQRRKRLPIPEAVGLMIQALQGLDHLDEKSMVHRDMKPPNMMLVPGYNGEGPDTTAEATLKILDIGLSRTLFDEGGPEGGEAIDLTREGTLLGTANYMAPEQARDAHNADIRSDIYSLGCVLYELLTGQPPFVDTNMVRQIRRHAVEIPRPLSEKIQGVSDSLEAIVQKMLAKDPAMRYPTPGLVLKDLRNLLSAEPAPPPKPPRPLRSFLTWLETTKEVEGKDPAASSLVPVPIPIPVPAPAIPPVTAKKPADVPLAPPPVSPGPRPVSSPVPAAPVPPPVMAPPVAAPVARPIVPPPPVIPPAPVAPPIPVLQPVAVAVPMPSPVRNNTLPSAAVPENPAQMLLGILHAFYAFLKSLTLRDWICIGTGVLLTLAGQGLWTLVRKILG